MFLLVFQVSVVSDDLVLSRQTGTVRLSQLATTVGETSSTLASYMVAAEAEHVSTNASITGAISAAVSAGSVALAAQANISTQMSATSSMSIVSAVAVWRLVKTDHAQTWLDAPAVEVLQTPCWSSIAQSPGPWINLICFLMCRFCRICLPRLPYKRTTKRQPRRRLFRL